MHCPSHKMNAKIAQVRIYVDGEVEKFCKYEVDHENLLSGGHLDAQIKRFERLWKIHFFVRKDLKPKIDKIYPIIKLAIDKIILENLSSSENANEYSHMIATTLAGNPESGLYGKKVINKNDINKVAAHRKSNDGYNTYPTGTISIKQCVKDNENK